MATGLANLPGLPSELTEMLAQVSVIAAAGDDVGERERQYAALERMLEQAGQAVLAQSGVTAEAGACSPAQLTCSGRKRRRLIGSSCAEARLARIRLVCCDMDGTWLGPDHAPTRGGMRALQLAESSRCGNITWVFATGRCPASAAGVAQIDRLLDRPGIYSNGAVVLGAGGVELYALDLPSCALELATSISQRKGGISCDVSVLFNDRSTFYYVRQDETEELPRHALHLHEVYHDPRPVAVDKLPDDASIQLIHIVGNSEALDLVQSQCEAELKGVAAVARNLPTDLVLTHVDAHKGFAVKQLCRALKLGSDNGKDQGISVDQAKQNGVVLCMGDSGNDCTMLESCDGIGVAMANARQETLDAAEFCTQRTNGDEICGVLEVIELVYQAKSAQDIHNPISSTRRRPAVINTANMLHRWTMDSPATVAETRAAASSAKERPYIGVVCPDTATFREHVSLVQPSDLVLELGCSFGRCTYLLGQRLTNPAKQLIGVDTSREELAAAMAEYPDLVFKRGDVLRDPMGTLNIVRAMCVANDDGGDGGSDLCVFVDIGGNRELEALVALLPWIATALPRIPRLIVVKSETLSAAVLEKGGVFDWAWLQAKSKTALLARRCCTRGSGEAEFMAEPDLRMPHPLKAPLRKNPDGLPICRFHNYNPRHKGCKMHRDIEGHGTSCPYDHEHCHWCGVKGHIALDCQAAMPLI